MRTAISDQEKFDKIVVVSICRHGCHDICRVGGEEVSVRRLHHSRPLVKYGIRRLAWSLVSGDVLTWRP